MAEQLAYERELQHGAVTYRQLVGSGWTWPMIRKALRRRELARVWGQVYVDHTGPLTPQQRAWAGVLHAEPAALCLSSAEDLSAEGPVHVAVERGRRLTKIEGIDLHQVTGLAGQIRFRSSPPRLTFEHNLLLRIQLAQDEEAVVGLLADHVGRRGVTVASMLRALELPRRQRHKRLVLEVLGDIATGVESVLERGWVRRVERPHRLPTPVRQAVRVVTGGVERRDMDYVEYGVVIELDGRLNHASWAAGNRDAARDLADLRTGRTVVRLRWRQVMVESCTTAASVGAILQRNGWAGAPIPCSPTCPSGSTTVIG